mgnify:CR=1 FL=1
MSFDVLQDKIRAMKNPTVVGLDPKPEYVPPQMRKECYDQYGETLEGAAEAIYRFNCGLMDALCDIVPAVKPQAAYYERLGWRGMEALERTIRYAREKGFFVIADIKRGDIGSTAQAYSDGWLGKTKVGSAERTAFDADCVTINGYMGSDLSLRPARTAPPPGAHVFPGARLRRPGRHRGGCAVCVQQVRPRSHRQFLPRHHVRLAENRPGRLRLSAGRPGRRRRHAGRYQTVRNHRVALRRELAGGPGAVQNRDLLRAAAAPGCAVPHGKRATRGRKAYAH